MRRRLTAAAIALLVTGLAAGCGDGDAGDGKTAATPAPLAKSDFVKRADEICVSTAQELADAGAKLRAASGKAGELPERKQIVKFLTATSLPAYERMLGSLRSIAPPEPDRATIEAFTGSLARAIETVKADPARYSKPGVSDPFADANERARKYGLKACGSGG